ncbi:hypothetical protein DFS34DRAFT_294081 [Phlyctochytrium arcticum]|nr:hypothetical protein DFS34DRAFT_294081 [Phlyctochytrium arcticum]
MMREVEKFSIACQKYLGELASASVTFAETRDGATPKTMYLVELRGAIGKFCLDILKTYLDVAVHILPRTKKLQFWSLSDSQRLTSNVIYACFINAPTHDQNVAILNTLLEKIRQWRIPIMSAVCEGASHALATKGLARPAFITAVWRSERWSVEDLSQAQAVEYLRENASVFATDGDQSVGLFSTHIATRIEDLLPLRTWEGPIFVQFLLRVLQLCPSEVGSTARGLARRRHTSIRKHNGNMW